MSATAPRRAPASIVLAALLAACAEHVSAPPTDAGAPVVDIVAIDVTALDVPTVDRPVVDRPRSDVGFDLGAPDAGVDAAVRLEVPVDPLAVPAPGSECTSDASVRAGDPTIDPPRPIVPQSVSRVTSQRPSFRWALPAGTTGARVEVCADRCCTRVITTLDAEGTTVRPSAALPPGVVFWRMFGLAGGATGSRASYTWEFEVRRRDTPVDSSWGTIRDFTGDGYDDLLVLPPAGMSPVAQPLQVIAGSAGGPRMPTQLAVLPEIQGNDLLIGDFNGDGVADFTYVAGASGDIGNAVYVLTGVIGEVPRMTTIRGSRAQRISLVGPAVGDWNGDGYSDLLVTAIFRREGANPPAGSLLLVFHGSHQGLATVPQRAIHFPTALEAASVSITGSVDDLDLDGFSDVFLDGARRPASPSEKYVAFGNASGRLRLEPFPVPTEYVREFEQVVFPRPTGDLNGDARPDLAVLPLNRGELLVYLGSKGFADPSLLLTEPPHPGGGGGGFASQWSAGDLNGDGLADLLVSSPVSYTEVRGPLESPYNLGRLYVFLGSRVGLMPDPVVFDRLDPMDSEHNPSYFADRVVSPGDIDADGIDDGVVLDRFYGTLCVIHGVEILAGAGLGGCMAVPGSAGYVF